MPAGAAIFRRSTVSLQPLLIKLNCRMQHCLCWFNASINFRRAMHTPWGDVLMFATLRRILGTGTRRTIFAFLLLLFWRRRRRLLRFQFCTGVISILCLRSWYNPAHTYSVRVFTTNCRIWSLDDKRCFILHINSKLSSKKVSRKSSIASHFVYISVWTF